MVSKEEMKPHLQDIFDKLSCYFPINFKPPKDDRFKITPAQLQEKLRSCFLASDNSEFIDEIFPFILDKMSAQDKYTRLECVSLIGELVYKLDLSLLKKHIEVCITSLLNDFFNLMDTEIQN